MLARLLILFALFLTVSCQRVSNVISNVRLDCGSETEWQDAYLKFVDGVGNPLTGNMIEFRSLEGQSSQNLALSTKGCLALAKSGLWLIRHREKPEGLVVDFAKLHESAALQLQDISGENLKPTCPAYEAGRNLDLRTVLGPRGEHDFRGYEINFAIRSDKVQKNWPSQNFAQLQSIELAGVFPEGVVNLDVTVTNHFRGGEQSKQSCAVKFDYTGPVILSALLQGPAKSYKGRPFVSLNSDQDLRFTSSADDFASFDVCYGKRPDWDSGEAIGDFKPLCDKPERIAADRPVPFDVRQGFWQVQYRGVDPAGNVSEWSEPVILLLEQLTTKQRIVNKASAQAAEMATKGYAATALGMLKGLDIYSEWTRLPTAYEREQMESAIILTLHRPWMEPSVQQIMRVVPNNYYPRIAFPLLGGRKFISIEGVSSANGGWRFETTLTDAETFETQLLPAPKYLPDDWNVSADGTKFFWYEGRTLFYAKVSNSEIKPQLLELSDYIESVRFLKGGDSMVIRTLDDHKLTYYEAGDELKELSHEFYTSKIDEIENGPVTNVISDDSHGILIEDIEKNNLVYWSLFDEADKHPLNFDSQLIPGFNIRYDALRVTDTDQHFFVSLSYHDYPFCSYYYYDATLPDSDKAKLKLESMPCNTQNPGVAIDSDVWLKGDGDSSVVVYKPGSAAFRKSVLTPELSSGTIQRSFDRFITPSGKWMFSGSTEYYDQGNENSDYHGHIRAWMSDEKGNFNLTRDFWACEDGFLLDPNKFQFDEKNEVLFHLCQYGSTVWIWNMKTNPPQLIDTLNIGESARSTLVIDNQLIVGSISGFLYFYDLHGGEKPSLNRKLKLADEPIIRLSFDQETKRLYTTEIRGDKPIKTWDINNLSTPIHEFTVPSRNLVRTIISSNGKYMAASSEEDSRVVVWNLDSLQATPFSEHAGLVSDMTFVGETSILASGSNRGALKLWDFKNPEIPAVTFSPSLTRSIKTIASVPGRNEFVVETGESRMFHYRLDSMEGILRKTCDTLHPYLHYVGDSYPEQVKACHTLGTAQ